MAISTGTKIVPLISSGTAGPLGVVHLPRLWSKITLDAVGALPEGYHVVGSGFDALTLNNLGLDKDEVVTYVKTQRPTYPQFEQWILKKKGGKLDPAMVKKHNETLLGYHHAADKAKHMRDDMGVAHSECTDAVTLNSLDDLHAFYKTIYG